MKPSSSTKTGPCSVRVRTLDGSKDVRGARREPKGWPGLNVGLSCTKDDLRLPWLVDLGLCY